MIFATALVLGVLLGQPESGQSAVAVGETAEDCAANRWGVCGSVFDEPPGNDREPVAYQTGLEPLTPEPSRAGDQAESGCRRVRESYRDPATGALGIRWGVTCIEVSGSPPD
jgi:hypothetical protein